MVLSWLKNKSVAKQRANVERDLSALIELAEDAEKVIQRTGHPLQGRAAARITEAQKSLLWSLVGPVPLADLREQFLRPVLANQDLSESSHLAIRHVFETASQDR